MLIQSNVKTATLARHAERRGSAFTVCEHLANAQIAEAVSAAWAADSFSTNYDCSLGIALGGQPFSSAANSAEWSTAFSSAWYAAFDDLAAPRTSWATLFAARTSKLASSAGALGAAYDAILIDDLAGTTLAPAKSAISLIEAASKGAVDVQSVSAWRSSLVDRLRSWFEQDKPTTQREFWPFFNAISQSGFGKSRVVSDFTPQGAWFVEPDLQLDLSNRDVRSLIAALVSELENFEVDAFLSAVVLRVHQTIRQQIESRATARRTAPGTCNAHQPPSTHEWVLCFAIHTGNSPPAEAAERLAVGMALENHLASKVSHAKIPRRRRFTDLSDTFRGRRTGPRFGCSPRTSTLPCCGVHNPGRRRIRLHRSLGKCA